MFDKATSCLTDFVNIRCGNDAAVFLETIMVGVQPPVCEKREYKYASDINNSDPNNAPASKSTYICVISSILSCIYIAIYRQR